MAGKVALVKDEAQTEEQFQLTAAEKNTYHIDFTHSAPIEQKEKLNTQMGSLIKNQTEGQFKITHKEFADYFEMLAKNDLGAFNKLRTDAGLTTIHVSDPALMHAAANELATTVLKEALRRQETTIAWLKEIEKIKKLGDAEGAKELDNMLEHALKTKNKAAWDNYVQEQKTRLVDEGKTDLAASLGEVQQASADKWLELRDWKPLSAMTGLIPAMLAKHVGEYAVKLMENIDGYLREYLERSATIFNGKMYMTSEEKKIMAHELEEAQKAKEKLEEKGGNQKLFEKNFEKHLKTELAAMQKSISDENVLKAVKKLDSDASKLSPADLMLENMHPSVATGMLKAYRRAAVDTATAMA